MNQREWEDFSLDGSAYIVRVLDGTAVLSSVPVDYSRLAAHEFTELPFDRPLDFTVNVSCCDDQGAVGVFSTHTQPEPMRGVLSAEQVGCGALLQWTDVVATSYEIDVTQVNSGVVFTRRVGNVTHTGVDLLNYPLNQSFRFEVFSVKALGERTEFPVSATVYMDLGRCFG